MATFFALLDNRNHPVEAIFAATDIAEENRLRECAAATKIQSAGRMRASRKRFLGVLRCVIDVQRVFRGYLGRRRFLDRDIEASKMHQRAVLDHFATIVQARFRGFYSRKWRSDFFAQKKYLLLVKARSEQVLADATEARRQQEIDVEIANQAQMRAGFAVAASDMHHILSTASRASVLRPVVAPGSLQTVFGTNIEEEIRAMPVPRGKFKGRGFLSTERVHHAIQATSVSGEPRGKSLNACAPFYAQVEERQLEDQVHKKIVSSLHPGEFVTRKPAPPVYVRSLASGEEEPTQQTQQQQQTQVDTKSPPRMAAGNPRHSRR